MLKVALVSMSLMLIMSQAQARDERLKMPIVDAMNSPAAKQKLDSDIKLFFGDAKHPKPKQTLGVFTSNKKTNFFNKTDKEGCEWVFLGAAIALQDRAKREGGNAVVGIHSVYKNAENRSLTEYDCGAGSVMGGVALRGTVVTLP